MLQVSPPLFACTRVRPSYLRCKIMETKRSFSCRQPRVATNRSLFSWGSSRTQFPSITHPPVHNSCTLIGRAALMFETAHWCRYHRSLVLQLGPTHHSSLMNQSSCNRFTDFQKQIDNSLATWYLVCTYKWSCTCLIEWCYWSESFGAFYRLKAQVEFKHCGRDLLNTWKHIWETQQ